MAQQSTPGFVNVQNGLFNLLSEALVLPAGSPFQIVQPTVPLARGPMENAALWSFFNNIPPFSLTQNFIVSSGNQFPTDFSAVMSVLQGANVDFAGDIGPQAFAAWNVFVSTLPPTTTVGQLPGIFRNWALTHDFENVAIKGASDLAAMLLNPISNAQLGLLLYAPNGSRPFDWSGGYDALVSQLSVAQSQQFTMSDVTASSDVSNSWTQGANSGFFGLWANSSVATSQSEEFAAAHIDVQISFQHVTQFTAVPGAWYNSAALSEAFSANTGGPPWTPGSTPNWPDTFGSTGNMQRFAASLIVVSGLSVSVTADTTYSQSDQQTIMNNASGGLWPFYCSHSGSESNTSVSFNERGNISIDITTRSGLPVTPVVVGVNVITAAEFLGSSVNGRAIHERNRKVA